MPRTEGRSSSLELARTVRLIKRQQTPATGAAGLCRGGGGGGNGSDEGQQNAFRVVYSHTSWSSSHVAAVRCCRISVHLDFFQAL